MVLVRVPILFNGEWIEQNDEYKFKGSKAKGIMIPRSTTYAELVDKIAEVIDIDTSEFEITMKFKLKTSDPMPPVTIQTNDDVEFFLEEVASGMEFRNPLCITFERRSISTVPVDRQPSPRLSWEESHAFSSYVPPSFPILSSNNFTVADESPIECLPTTQLIDEQEAVNEFVTEVDCLDEPPLAVDLALGDNTPAPISSRTSNNGHVPRINLLTSSSNLLSTEVSGDTDVSMVKEVFESKEALQDSANNFKYCFMAIGSSLRGFTSCIRPVIAVDGTFMRGKYKGTLFIATSLDGNNQLYPVAFGVGDSENDASWEWFFMKLRESIGDVPNLVFISDRHGSIKKAVDKVFPTAGYGICTHHLKQNVNAHFKEVDVGALFELAAKAYRPIKFTQYMNVIRSVSLNVHQYLTDAGYEKWARSHFEGRRYGIMTTNIAEIKDGDLDGHVDVLQKTCSCNEFQIDQFPCEHVVAVLYAESIYPVGPQEEWDVSEEVRAYVLSPPMKKREVGRPRTTRIPSQGEDIVHRKCSRCGLRGHNRLTCTAATPLSEQEHGPMANQTAEEVLCCFMHRPR
ncbi:SWIM-type domain-containing protein [Citrus sinensis]|nr:SWIM-type domain-containing protein [Citrus sinensis]